MELLNKLLKSKEKIIHLQLRSNRNVIVLQDGFIVGRSVNTNRINISNYNNEGIYQSNNKGFIHLDIKYIWIDMYINWEPSVNDYIFINKFD